MFMVVRKSNLILLACIVLVFGFTVSLWFGNATEHSNDEAIAAFAVPTSGRVIVIDAGHGEIVNTINLSMYDY